MSPLLERYVRLTSFLEIFIGPLVFVAVRYEMAQLFWHSGRSKIQSWSTTLMLFKYEYKVPYIPSDLAAYLSVSIELTCPILLMLGLAARLATIPMLAMTAVIQLTYLQTHDHFYWAIMLALILCYGAGPLSLDFLIGKWLGKKKID